MNQTVRSKFVDLFTWCKVSFRLGSIKFQIILNDDKHSIYNKKSFSYHLWIRLLICTLEFGGLRLCLFHHSSIRSFAYDFRVAHARA
ncbi:hypothetical protein L596_012828 [Steinernema carpocapsae]|uniref:Uncharacterized protein n=1 Tax=Steinernema carpocapsae TaxID=34508 RepID=A0A4U5NYF2_STECR|nr:hypothetical protein L596_012828 [Steinernema carpocapsae]